MLRNSLSSLVKCESKVRMTGQMAEIISYFPSPLLLFNSLLFPVWEIAAPSLFEMGKAATAFTTRFFSFFPMMLAIAAWPLDCDGIWTNPHTLDWPLPLYLLVFSTQHCFAGVAGPATGRATTLLSLGFSALRTTPGLVGKTLRRKELLFPGTKSERRSTIGTLDRLVLKTHWMTSFFKVFS